MAINSHNYAVLQCSKIAPQQAMERLSVRRLASGSLHCDDAFRAVLSLGVRGGLYVVQTNRVG